MKPKRPERDPRGLQVRVTDVDSGWGKITRQTDDELFNFMFLLMLYAALILKLFSLNVFSGKA